MLEVGRPSYLIPGYSDGISEDGPDDRFVAGWGGQTAHVAVVVPQVGREQGAYPEGFKVDACA